MSHHLAFEGVMSTLKLDDPDRFADTLASHLLITTIEKQQLLETPSPYERLQKLQDFLEIEIEKIKAIHNELGRKDDRSDEIEELRQKIEEAGMPKETKEKALQELKRLEAMPGVSAEATVSRNYIEWLVSVPWKKTSLAKSIARATGRKFVRLSLGGVRDEAEIRGHRRTYIGAFPGQIIQRMKKAGTINPVFLLDEVDKMSMDFRGDPSAALLEVLDPEQNNTFTDHYLDVEYDLSKVMFIATANVTHTIPAPLKDRMEVLRLPGYTEPEKVEIAKKFLAPKAVEGAGLTKDNITFTDEAIQVVINRYTREAGVRNLERELSSICRKVARKVMSEGKTFHENVTP